ncbi:chromate efflux transporter [Leucothrix mucor]|uniref:chromate efflux transporter n=1 Tax=Leucothrix mucor TaxID=45248 RepID=UPI0003B4D5A8|nr:chromate efflux transporter [Leucothrix mucor]
MQKILEIFWKFLSLGCLSFGGPAAHLGYFHKAFVQQLKWIDEAGYARLVALCQVLPGPGSSQVGFAIGLRKGGLAGGIAAFIGFTTPSFILMYLLASNQPSETQAAWFSGLIHGLKLLAVVVVADATLSMWGSFCKDKLTRVIAVTAAMVLLVVPGLWIQIGVLIIAATLGLLLSKTKPSAPVIPAKTQKIAWGYLSVFIVLFIALPTLAFSSDWMKLLGDFYQSGSLVFGGGHVVLPLLQQSLGETVATDRFLMGYAAAQAVPGPMFTLGSFLGAELMSDQPFLGALLATIAIFLPGFLLVLALQGSWETLANKPKVSGAITGINAAVVGLLLPALYSPVFVSAVIAPLDMALVIAGFFALRGLKLPIIAVVFGFAVAGVLIHALTS